MRKVATITRAIKARTPDAVRLAPRLVRKPAVLRHWLLSARWAQIVLVLAALTMPSLIPSVVDAFLEKRYPPITIKEWYGLKKYIRQDPRLKSHQGLARVLLWTGSGSIVLCLLFSHIPRAIEKATALARRRESEADELTLSQASASILLYNSALSLASDPEYEASLSDKLRKLDERISKIPELESGVSAKPTSAVGIMQTVGLEVGQGRYSLQEQLGRGAMGTVYRAHDRVLARDVALKQLSFNLSLDQQLGVRFQQEAKALARLSHPNIVQVYDFVQDVEQAWIAMEFVEGEDLERSLRESRVLPIGKTVRLGVQLAEALAYAHERGVIHRDFKPANVILAQHGLPKVTDFGLAKLTHSSVHTQAGVVMGSPAYMSPEQATGKGADARSDIYALGATLYEMLAGCVPFEGDVESVIAQKLTNDPTPLTELNEHVPEKLNRLVLQMLAKEPDNRPKSMDAVAEALKDIENIHKK